MKHSVAFSQSVFEVPLWYPRLASGNGIEMTWVGRIKNFFITISGKIITGIIVDHVTKVSRSSNDSHLYSLEQSMELGHGVLWDTGEMM